MRTARLSALGLTLCIMAVAASGCDKKDPAGAHPEDVTPPEPAPTDDMLGDPPGGEDEVAADPEEDDGVAPEPEAGGEEVAAASDTPDTPATPASAGTEPTETGAGGEPKAEGPPPLPTPKFAKVDNSCGKDPGVGQKLKSFKLRSVSGKTMTNRTWGNKVLLVNFWGTWCKPCLKELPEFARLYRRYRKHGLVLVAIATDDDADAVKGVLEKSKIAAKVAIGGEAYAGKYGSPNFPFSFIVDPKGNITSSFRGYEPKCMGKLEADIRAQLEKRNES